MKCLHGELCAQSTTQKNLSGSAIKALAATSFAPKMKATYTKKPLLFRNLQNNHTLAAKKHGKLAKMRVVKNLLGTLRFIGRQRDGNGKKTLYDMCF